MLKIRAHHLLCIPRYYGGCYDKKFAKNMKKICLFIRKHPDTRIKVVSGKPDVLCVKCPYMKGSVCVQTPKMQKWVLSHDKKVLNYLKLKNNSVYIAKNIFNLSMDNADSVARICKTCIFREDCTNVGINNSFRKDINKNGHKI